ncbi:MAG: hypothetical protein KDC80_26520 [Saprospiraceae bacterium]|nr:hypothetical protein [Saprospiraceae bacterium]
MNFKQSILPLIILQLAILYQISAQPNFVVEGDSNSTDTVLKITTASQPHLDYVGPYVKSEPSPGRGIAASFYGGILGMAAESNLHTGLLGSSTLAYGLRGIGSMGSGANFQGGAGSLILGGSEYEFGSGQDEAVISTDPLLSSSDLWLSSNDNIVLQLDKNNDEEHSDLQIKNGLGEFIYFVKGSGHIQAGSKFHQKDLGSNNLIPICYGYVINDSLAFSSNNVLISKPGAIGPVLLDIDGYDFNTMDFTVIIRLLEEKPNTYTSWYATENGQLEIYAQERLGITPPYFYHDEDFQFIVFKP